MLGAKKKKAYRTSYANIRQMSWVINTYFTTFGHAVYVAICWRLCSVSTSAYNAKVEATFHSVDSALISVTGEDYENRKLLTPALDHRACP